MAAVLDATSDTGVAFAYAPRNLLDMQLKTFGDTLGGKDARREGINSFTFTTAASDPRGRLINGNRWPLSLSESLMLSY